MYKVYLCTTFMLQSVVVLYSVYTIEQTSSKRQANVFKIHVLIARVFCSMFASIHSASSTSYGN